MAETNARAGAAATASETDYLIQRVFDAPRDLVFRAWTEPKHLAQWWGPRGFTTTIEKMDVRPGGGYRITMHGPDGDVYPMTGSFREITRPARLVMTMDCAEHPDWWHDMIKPGRAKDERNPAGEIVTTVTFEERGGKTEVTVRMRFSSSEIRHSMVKHGMHDGWSQSFDKLAELLAAM
ncbi:MAG TPA: SRPBCC domain-containing protein [Candidatus Sulfotelmatobacter sp.]|nr:SRPBCC domain-containing protein [Candidatus Sulfotelmatobacter sp.]